MTTSLPTALLADDRRPAVVASLIGVVDAEVAAKTGLGGAAVKAAYAAVRKLGGGVLERAVDKMLPDFAVALDPFWAGYHSGGFGAHLAQSPDAAADALLAVTDARAESTSKEVLRKAYGSIRGKAHDNVVAALPRLGDAIEEHAAR